MTKRIHKGRCAVCIVLVLGIIITILFVRFRRTPLRQYYESNRETLEQLSQILFPLREERRVIVIRKGDDYLKYGEDAKALLTQVFSQAMCDEIYATASRDGINCCHFSISSEKMKYGIAYAEEGNIKKSLQKAHSQVH